MREKELTFNSDIFSQFYSNYVMHTYALLVLNNVPLK